MNKIEVCLSPELIHLYDLKGKIVVVVDIFRATSTMVTGLANGVSSITPVAGLETCRQMKSQGYIIAGERNGQTADGFELGNSPLSYLNNAFENKKIAVTTTNGTLTIEKSKTDAAEVLIGAFLNLKATAEYLAIQEKDVIIHCAGWKGMFNLEDSLYAGALVNSLKDHFTFECDGAIAMKALYEQNQDDLKGFLSQASHAKRLQNHNIDADIDFCLTLDKFDFIGKLEDEKLIKHPVH
ncbi:putative 2-phosphosulfolactate phosphatase [Echinicola pacifica]|uniref:Probable 2-phosphosulfolactate phosphatase n=1 Tax=Echinicola pacifica TaxID=346377 RepID=A0A918QEH2_9BACT|nr:2-phosphosulfolactate phosphatase [Echinicola pacifica]GGZ40610.1 putative 2-phosphosulfolactate phosphatase [Echinicola pacifica]